MFFLTVWKLKFSDETAAHDIFIKEHSVRGESLSKPKGRTLFVLNIPPWATKDSLQREFNKIKPVKNVIVQNKPSIQDEIEDNLTGSKYFPRHEPAKGFRVAYVVFEKAIHLVNALNETRTLVLSNESTPIVTGIKKWAEDYHESIPNRRHLEIEINTFMNKYDKEEKRASKDQTEGEPDEDGWITVTKKGRNPGLPRTEKTTHKIRKRDQASKKKKQLLNFYTFQIRESKMKHLASLRQKFAEDKERITTMKNTRKFKPF